MSKKRAGRPQGHYCKVCGEYKANEKFSGKGHAAHICKKCSQLSPAEQSEAMTMTRLMEFPIGRLSAGNKAWLENRVHDRRPEVAELAKEVYHLHFPYAERNKRKKQLIINTLMFEINTDIFDEYGDEMPVNVRFTIDRIRRVLTMTDFDGDGVKQTLTLDGKKVTALLRWVVHSLEIFMWEEDYRLSSPSTEDNLYLDLLPEFRPDVTWEEAHADAETAELEWEVSWRVNAAYSDGTAQEIVSYEDDLPDRPKELFFALLGYFEQDDEEAED